MRKLFSSLLLLLLTLCPVVSTAWNLPVPQKKTVTAELGSSLFVFNNMHPAQRIGLLGYRVEWTPIYTEIFAGGFGPSRSTTLAGADIGITFWGFGLSTGAAWLTGTSDSLSTHWQLVQSLRYSIPNTPVFIGFKHFSNGHKVFRHRMIPNHGENFLTLGVQFDF